MLCDFAENRTGGINNGGTRQHPIIGMTVHHMDGYWQGAESRFRDPSSGASACFGIRFDGSIIQWLDTDLVDYHACMAQWEGWFGVENESDPNLSDAPPTDAQIASMGRLAAWAGVPLVPATSRASGGIGYHRQFGGVCSQAWGQTACPGQGFIDSILAICQGGGNPTPPPPPPPPEGTSMEIAVVTNGGLTDYLYVDPVTGSLMWRHTDANGVTHAPVVVTVNANKDHRNLTVVQTAYGPLIYFFGPQMQLVKAYVSGYAYVAAYV